MKPIVEVCTGSYQDCLAAAKGGATRVELCGALSVGGLTPSLATLRRVKAETDLCIIPILRPRAAGFCYDSFDTAVMFDDARLLMENGAHGLSFGFLQEDGSFDAAKMRDMTELIHSFNGEAVCHRAFDVSKDAFAAIETLIDLGVDRLLTSGLAPKAPAGIEMLAELQKRYGAHIELLAGSGVTYENAPAIMAATGISQVHSSCKAYVTDPTTVMNQVSYAYLDGDHVSDYDIVDAAIVRKLVDAVGA